MYYIFFCMVWLASCVCPRVMKISGACKLDRHENIRIRSYNGETDRARLEDLERRCEVGPAERVFLFTDTLGDPICRIRNSPIYTMLLAETEKEKELVGVIQGSIKVVTVAEELAKVGYTLGLRVAPPHRRRGIGSSLVRRLEEWFVANDADYAYMATEKDNEASVKLFVEKHGFVKFRTPAILVNPVSHRPLRISRGVEVAKLDAGEAESLYRKHMGSAEFFPHDIDSILRNKSSLGTWVACPRGERWAPPGGGSRPSSWAAVSVWNSGGLFKLRLGKAPISCSVYTKSSRIVESLVPCLNVPTLPDFFRPFGFYFVYGVYREGGESGKMVRNLCRFVHNMASTTRGHEDCKAVVTEVSGEDGVRLHIPHWKLLSCPEDLWCIKGLKENKKSVGEVVRARACGLFVDPREV